MDVPFGFWSSSPPLAATQQPIKLPDAQSDPEEYKLVRRISELALTIERSVLDASRKEIVSKSIVELSEKVKDLNDLRERKIAMISPSITYISEPHECKLAPSPSGESDPNLVVEAPNPVVADTTAAAAAALPQVRTLVDDLPREPLQEPVIKISPFHLEQNLVHLNKLHSNIRKVRKEEITLEGIEIPTENRGKRKLELMVIQIRAFIDIINKVTDELNLYTADLPRIKKEARDRVYERMEQNIVLARKVHQTLVEEVAFFKGIYYNQGVVMTKARFNSWMFKPTPDPILLLTPFTEIKTLTL